ncbi:MAG: putative toxin-antitoxin system toxin component, PIN family [Gemmataceae bacterium]
MSAAVNPDGPRRRAVERAVRQRVRLIASAYILNEVERVLVEDFDKSPRFAALTVQNILRMTRLVRLPESIPSHVATDPNDDPIVQTALTGKADYLVTADKVLLALAKVRDVEIIGLDDWLALLPPDD